MLSEDHDNKRVMRRPLVHGVSRREMYSELRQPGKVIAALHTVKRHARSTRMPPFYRLTRSLENELTVLCMDIERMRGGSDRRPLFVQGDFKNVSEILLDFKLFTLAQPSHDIPGAMRSIFQATINLLTITAPDYAHIIRTYNPRSALNQIRSSMRRDPLLLRELAPDEISDLEKFCSRAYSHSNAWNFGQELPHYKEISKSVPPAILDLHRERIPELVDQACFKAETGIRLVRNTLEGFRDIYGLKADCDILMRDTVPAHETSASYQSRHGRHNFTFTNFFMDTWEQQFLAVLHECIHAFQEEREKGDTHLLFSRRPATVLRFETLRSRKGHSADIRTNFIRAREVFGAKLGMTMYRREWSEREAFYGEGLARACIWQNLQKRTYARSLLMEADDIVFLDRHPEQIRHNCDIRMLIRQLKKPSLALAA